MSAAAPGPLAVILRALRATLGITQSQHAKRLGLRRAELSALENAVKTHTLRSVEGIIDRTIFRIGRPCLCEPDSIGLADRAKLAYLVAGGWLAEDAAEQLHDSRGSVRELVDLGRGEKASRRTQINERRRRGGPRLRQARVALRGQEKPARTGAAQTAGGPKDERVSPARGNT